MTLTRHYRGHHPPSSRRSGCFALLATEHVPLAPSEPEPAAHQYALAIVSTCGACPSTARLRPISSIVGSGTARSGRFPPGVTPSAADLRVGVEDVLGHGGRGPAARGGGGHARQLAASKAPCAQARAHSGRWLGGGRLHADGVRPPVEATSTQQLADPAALGLCPGQPHAVIGHMLGIYRPPTRFSSSSPTKQKQIYTIHIKTTTNQGHGLARQQRACSTSRPAERRGEEEEEEEEEEEMSPGKTIHNDPWH